jgi:GalNAc-alpha-(1->4)-GalNAc-alpha-(1->3)-diNAcBac-PP-undecaprenol alpha-1,4-N-acetyl-D-galactosaminyltransferase
MFCSGSMQGGGAERAISLLANEFVTRGIQVIILVVRGSSVYELDSKVSLITLFEEHEFNTSIRNKISRRFNFWPRLINAVKQVGPDVIIPVHGGGWNAKFVLLAKSLGVKVIVAEQISHTVKATEILRIIERRLIYRWANALTVLTQSDFQFYNSYLQNVSLVPNPACFPYDEAIIRRRRVLLAAGRLNSWHHKGLDNLLGVFARVSIKYPDWRLQIAGTGDVGKAYLINLAQKLGIYEKVDFLGFRKDIDIVMRESEVFVLSSRYEGLGNVLIEAMSQGCACVSFDCMAGPSDIIAHEVDGMLVEDQNLAALANTIDRMMKDAPLRARLSSAARDSALRYAPTKITEQWLHLFKKLKLKP